MKISCNSKNPKICTSSNKNLMHSSVASISAYRRWILFEVLGNTLQSMRRKGSSGYIGPGCKPCITNGNINIVSDSVIMWLTISMINGEPVKNTPNMVAEPLCNSKRHDRTVNLGEHTITPAVIFYGGAKRVRSTINESDTTRKDYNEKIYKTKASGDMLGERKFRKMMTKLTEVTALRGLNLEEVRKFFVGCPKLFCCT